ncbi:MAG: helix-turn-helix domain-containing protein [Candidatus Promineifilaceae bacterium]|jgi:putative transcriptional regulator
MIVNMLPELMRQRNVSIRELSRLTGVTYTTIRAVHNGERGSIKLDVLDAICRALELQPGDILRYTVPGEPIPSPPSQPPVDKPRTRLIQRTQKTSKAPPGGSDAWVTWE